MGRLEKSHHAESSSNKGMPTNCGHITDALLWPTLRIAANPVVRGSTCAGQTIRPKGKAATAIPTPCQKRDIRSAHRV